MKLWFMEEDDKYMVKKTPLCIKLNKEANDKYKAVTSAENGAFNGLDCHGKDKPRCISINKKIHSLELEYRKAAATERLHCRPKK
jgi:hypothetical protein